DALPIFREQIAQALVPQGPYAPTTSAASAVEESAPPTAQVTKTTLGNNVVDVEVSATSLDTTTSSAAGPEGNSTPVAKTGNDGAGSQNPVEQGESEGSSDTGLSDTGLSDDDSTTALKNDESTTPSGGTDLSNGNKVSPTATTAATTQNGVAKNRGLTKASLGDATGGSSGGDSGSATGSSRTTAGSGNTGGSDSGDE